MGSTIPVGSMGVGLTVHGSGCRAQGAGCRVQCAGFRVRGPGCRVHGNDLYPGFPLGAGRSLIEGQARSNHQSLLGCTRRRKSGAELSHSVFVG